MSKLQRKDEALREVCNRWDCKWDPGEGLPNSDFLNSEIKSWLREWPRIVEQNGVLYRSVEDPGLGQVLQLLVPRCLRAVIIDASHDKWGHQGVGRTLSFIKRRCYWPGMSGDVREHIHNCFHCTITKAPTPTVRTPMRHLHAFRPLERLSIDFLKLDRGHGNYEDVLVMTDSFTKFAVATPCKDQMAVTVARALKDHWFVHYGVPAQIHSDRGANFESCLVQELCSLYGIQKTRTTPYHAQGNRQTERFNKTLCNLVKSLEKQRRNRCPELLPHLIFMYNSTPHCVTGFAPYTLMFGRQPSVPLDQLLSNTRNDWSEDFVRQQAQFIKRAHKLAKDRIISAASSNKKRYDRHAKANPLPIGSRVLIKRCAFRGRHKLEDHFGEEQYIVVKCNAEQDLYEVRPALGGPGKWLNRKMLIIDPRRELTNVGEPLQDVFNTDALQTDTDESSSEGSDEELVVAIPQGLFEVPKMATSDVGKPTKQPDHDDKVAQSSAVPGLRRSKRIEEKRILGSWPSAITGNSWLE